jgi:hypothetical protein
MKVFILTNLAIIASFAVMSAAIMVAPPSHFGHTVEVETDALDADDRIGRDLLRHRRLLLDLV